MTGAGPAADAGIVIGVCSLAMSIIALLYTHGRNKANAAREFENRVTSVTDRVAILETKIDVFWRNVAFDAARILHSPTPGRERLDSLLDRFRDGSLTPREVAELVAILERIRDAQHGEPVAGKPVQPGDQIAAAIIIRAVAETNLSVEGG